MRRINQCMNTQLLGICKRAVLLEDLNSKLLNYLPHHLRDRCHVGSFNGGCLSIVTQDSASASELRYLLPELRDTLRKEAGIYQLTSIKLTIATPETSSPSQHQPTLELSAQARDTIITEGNQCTYPPLKQALLALGRKTS